MKRLLQKLFGTSTTRTAQPVVRKSRLQIEHLENRLVPTTFTYSKPVVDWSATTIQSTTTALISTGATVQKVEPISVAGNYLLSTTFTLADSPISKKYEELGGPNGKLGLPVTLEDFASDGQGRFQHFEHGSIYWSYLTEAHQIEGLIREKWVALGAERVVGYPTNDQSTTDNVAYFNDFMSFAPGNPRSTIEFSDATGTHFVSGAIRDKWEKLGRETFGYPITDEFKLGDKVGSGQHFFKPDANFHSSIILGPATDAHELHGSIRDKWFKLGWEGYGYPTTDVKDTAGLKGKIASFKSPVDGKLTSIVTSERLGTREVHGLIRDKWLSVGGTKAGLPFSDETTGLWGDGGVGFFPARNKYVYSLFWNDVSQKGFWIYIKNDTDGPYVGSLSGTPETGVVPNEDNFTPSKVRSLEFTCADQSTINPSTFILSSAESVSVTAATSAGANYAYESIRSLGLKSYSNGDQHFNFGGKSEKWVLGADGKQYFITPDGILYEWDLKSGPGFVVPLTGKQVAGLDNAFWEDAKLLTNTKAGLVTISAAMADQVYQLDATLGLHNDGNLFVNWGGRNEKWLQDAKNQWYFITPDGKLYLWNGSPATALTGSQVAALDPIYCVRPDLLYNAKTTNAVVAEAERLDSTLGLWADNQLQNWGGRNEKWMHGANNQWYFITPDGKLYRWNGSPASALTGALVSTLTADYWASPELLYDAQLLNHRVVYLA